MIVNAYIDIETGKCGFQGDALSNVRDGVYVDNSVDPPHVGSLSNLRFAKIGHREFEDIERTSGYLNGIGKDRTISEAASNPERWGTRPTGG